jgi:hypothetical protein
MVELFMQYLPTIAECAGILLLIAIVAVWFGCFWLRTLRDSEDDAA